MQELYNIKGETKDMADVKRDLPRGMGYKSCFMVVEGATQKDVAEAFLQGRKMKYAYDAGLEKIHKSGAKEKRLMVTGTYKKQNYVLGDEVGSFFYDTEEFLNKCENFSKVYVYMTHRVSETHGFALVENGQLVRLFCYDENEIQNIGEPLPEEIELGYKLPTNFDEARDEEFTTVNEDLIMELALCQVGIDIEKYPYKDVKLGKRFEYSGELAANPYPGEDDEIPEEVWKLSEVQRFMDCTSVDARIQLVEELKDTLTHQIIDAFGEIADHMPENNRLYARMDELLCRLNSMKIYEVDSCEETVLSKEEFYEKINNGIYIFEGFTFKHFAIENIRCETLTFIDCKFFDMKLIHNETSRFECQECRFVKSEICGKLKNVCIELNKVDFIYCWIHDLEISGEQKDAEWKSCFYKRCIFENIELCMELSIVNGYYMDCKGEQLELDIRRFFSSSFESCKFEDVIIGADVIENRFWDVEILKLAKADVGREVTWSLNTFRSCMINGEEKEKSLFEVQQEMKRFSVQMEAGKS